MASLPSALANLSVELSAAALKPAATPRYRKRGRVQWGSLRYRQQLQRIAYREAHPHQVAQVVDKERAEEALTAPTRKDLPAGQQRSFYTKVVLFS